MKTARRGQTEGYRTFARPAICWLGILVIAILLAGCGGGGETTAIPATVGHAVELPTAARALTPSMAMPSAMAMPTVAITTPSPRATTAPSASPGQPRGAASPTAGGQAGATVEVRIVNFAFVPASVTVPVGTTVVWRLAEGYHTVVSADFRLNSPILEQVGDSYSHTFTQEGVYDYVCGVHPEMLGVVQVVR